MMPCFVCCRCVLSTRLILFLSFCFSTRLSFLYPVVIHWTIKRIEMLQPFVSPLWHSENGGHCAVKCKV